MLLALILAAAVPAGSSINPFSTATDPNVVLRVAPTGFSGSQIASAPFNNLLWSEDLTNAVWSTTGSTGSPTVTANTSDVPDPNGGNTASKLVFPDTTALTTAQYSLAYQSIAVGVPSYATSIYCRTLSGTAQIDFGFQNSDGSYRTSPSAGRQTVTSTWTRFQGAGVGVASGNAAQGIGIERRLPGNPAGQPTQTIYCWGGQHEIGATAGQYVRTTTTARYGYTLQGSYGEGVTFTRATSATCTPASGQVYTVASGVPCLTEQGYRADPQATNLLLRSRDLSDAAWPKAVTGCTVTVTGNSTDLLAPDGTNAAAKVVFSSCSGASNFAVIQQGYTATAAAYSHSIYAKTLSGTYTFNHLVTINNTSGTAALCTANSTSWTRCSLPNVTETATSWFYTLGFDGRGPGNTAISAGTVYLWGGQAELGSASTSYIPTLGTTVQRNAEVLTYAPPAGKWPTSTGCAAFTFVPNWSGAGIPNYQQFLLDGRGGTLSAGMAVTIESNGSSTFQVINTAGTATNLTSGANTYVSGTRYRFQLNWDGTGLRGFINGVSQGSAATPGVIDLPSSVKFGSYLAGSLQSIGQTSDWVFGTSTSACPVL